mmetsp:Transcript_58832/g.102955  ORF Transcript_58832/g.102955 Transcript_58832/m.102955 type:complete len:622 (-) Transcript_58832:140-2005(-)
MKKGFLHAVKMADGPRTRSLKESANGTGQEDIDIERLEAQLAEAEEELQHRRRERLRVESEASEESGGPTNAAQQRAAGVQTATALPAALPGEEALNALASHQEPPPAVLHRLAECFMLVIEARPLISLGDHPLPAHVPWRNLQLLLRKSAGSHKASVIAEALASEPYGAKLRQAVRDRLTSGDQPLTREAVREVDERCVCFFDTVEAFVGDAPGAGGLATPLPADESGEETTSGQTARERAATAVAVQEKEVSNLRRQLRNARRAAEKKHAEEEGDKQSQLEAKKLAQVLQEQEREAKREVLAKVAADREAASATSAASPQEDAKDAASKPAARVTPSTAAPPLAASCTQMVMYTLSQTEVPELQESVLISIIGSLNDPRLGAHRTLEITGFAEVREEPEIAEQRAENVRAWLVDNGADEDKLEMAQPRVEEPRGSRRTEMRLMDRNPSTQKASFGAAKVMADFESIRSHSQKLMQDHSSKLLTNSGNSESEPVEVAPAEVEVVGGNPPPPETADSESGGAGAPCILIEEIRDDATPNPATPGSGPERRRLRVTFAAPNLEARDAALEVGSLAVRLASHKGAWPAVEAALPFAVDPETAGAPRFSRKKGTLVLQLEESLS